MNGARSLSRRGLLATAAGLVGAATATRIAAQDTAQTRGAADPLMNPEIVGQTRAVATSLDNAEEIKVIELQLKCTCPCNLDIFTCRTTDFTCTYSPELHQEVVALYTAGQNADQIIAAFVTKYGEQVLLAPNARGFNLLGYLLPGAAILTAASILGFLLLRRHRERMLLATPAAVPGPTTLDAEQQQRLEAALSEVER